ncbi:NAD-dependent malic enzyme [Singulisphaera sp. GP187]|uniref:NAD-dependent malic enzyme n=1 Tax=Singulisphaera sp. GP187 TaxID=1882752 RepID=UPI000941098F
MTVDAETGDEIVEVPLTALSLLDCPLFNKGSAFPEDERAEFGLHGLLPPHVGSIDEQLDRRYRDFEQKRTELQQHIYLRDLQDRNEVLFYRLMADHITEMMPLIYTPVVGEACQYFSRTYRRPRGLFVSYEHRANLETILENRPYRDVDVIVVTDGERILGLGDLGVGGMGIPVGKLSLYTLCGGINPARTLPIFLDAGTDNEEALADPLYLGWRHPRMRGTEYDDFIEQFVSAVTRVLPNTLLQWEDFALPNARRLLDQYRDRLCTFNDDIQGTAAVSLAAILAAGHVSGTRLADQRVAILGAGSAGTGIADQIVTAMVAEGRTEREALAQLWLVDRDGLLHSAMTGLQPFQRRFAQPLERLEGWAHESGGYTLGEVVKNVHPTVLIGTSGRPGTFTEEVVRAMAQHVDRPAIFPLSNPNSRCEATPADVIAWTDGRALVATGSPFPDVVFGGRTFAVGQCNNAYIFPGLGQGVIASGARRVPEDLFLASARALAEASPARTTLGGSLFPALENIASVSRRIALAVAGEAHRLGIADPVPLEQLERRIDARWWHPRYAKLRRRR